MKFDEIIEVPCAPGSAGAEGSDAVCPDRTFSPSSDERCADAAFADANPDICSGYPRLILKPAVLCLSAFQSYQLKTYLYANGVEMEIENGLTYTTSDNTMAEVGAVSGKVMGVSVGICFISVSWQNLSASCQITIAETTVSVGLMVLVDNSLSMKSKFNSVYPSKLAYAKSMARLFANELNTNKDKMGVIAFNESGDLIEDLTDDSADLVAAVNSIQTTNLRTNIDDALELAIERLNADSTISRPVVIILTDGENKLGDDPRIRSSQFKEEGGVVVVCGIRAHGQAYDLLMKMASGGYFINAHDSTYEAALSYMSGLKGYLCAGNCAPVGDVIIPYPALDYTGFINWNVDGKVDLVGDWLWDVLPGNGLYVDLVGSTSPYRGKLTSKTQFNLVAGRQYQVVVTLAGNQRRNNGSYTVNIRMGAHLNANVTITDWKQPLTEYVYAWTQGGDEGALLVIEQTIVPVEIFKVGTLLGHVIVRDVTADTVLLTDNFDTENPTYIPPRCGQGFNTQTSSYAYGTMCYGYGCLTVPPIEQTPDPSPETQSLEE